MKLTDFERTLLDAYLVGDFPIFADLRTQLGAISAKKREYTPVGFFVEFEGVHSESKLGGFDCQMGDVNVILPSLKLGMGTVLFIAKGRMELLEGFTFGEHWTGSTEGFSLAYRDGSPQRNENDIPDCLKQNSGKPGGRSNR